MSRGRSDYFLEASLAPSAQRLRRESDVHECGLLTARFQIAEAMVEMSWSMTWAVGVHEMSSFTTEIETSPWLLIKRRYHGRSEAVCFHERFSRVCSQTCDALSHYGKLSWSQREFCAVACRDIALLQLTNNSDCMVRVGRPCRQCRTVKIRISRCTG